MYVKAMTCSERVEVLYVSKAPFVSPTHATSLIGLPVIGAAGSSWACWAGEDGIEGGVCHGLHTSWYTDDTAGSAVVV